MTSRETPLCCMLHIYLCAAAASVRPLCSLAVHLSALTIIITLTATRAGKRLCSTERHQRGLSGSCRLSPNMMSETKQYRLTHDSYLWFSQWIHFLKTRICFNPLAQRSFLWLKWQLNYIWTYCTFIPHIKSVWLAGRDSSFH